MEKNSSVVTNGLVMHLNAKQATGAAPGSNVPPTTIWKDLSGHGFDGVLNKFDYTATSGWDSESLVFDGVDDYVQIADNGIGKFDYQEFTIEAWVQMEFPGRNPIFSYEYNTLQDPYYCAFLMGAMNTPTQRAVIFAWNMGNTTKKLSVLFPDSFDTSQFIHVVATCKSGEQKIYINNVLSAQSNHTGTITYTPSPIYVGRHFYERNSKYNGKVSAIRYYDRVLSPAEIDQNYNAGASTQYINVKDYGAKGDGKTDDTKALQAAVDAAAATDHKNVSVPTGIYKVSAVQSLKLHDGISLYMTDDTMLKAIDNDKPYTAVLKIENVKNVSVYGGIICGDSEGHTIPAEKDHQHGMGVFITGAQDVLIKDTIAEQCVGDGFYIGREIFNSGYTVKELNAIPFNIQLIDIESRNNRRQGISLIAGRNIDIIRPFLHGTKGHDPEAGLDIEPNWKEEGDEDKDLIENVNVIDAVTKNNNGAGIQVYLGHLAGASIPASINIVNHCDEGSRQGMVLKAHPADPRFVEGKVIVNGAEFKNNKENGLLILEHDYRSYDIEINDPHIINANRLNIPEIQSTHWGLGGTAIYLGSKDGSKDGTITGNVTIRRAVVRDTGTPELTLRAIKIWDNKKLEKVKIINLDNRLKTANLDPYVVLE